MSNASGSATSNSATLTVLANVAPTGTITAPANGTSYRGGQTFTFSGTGTDPEDGTLPASAFTWRVDFHHDDHTHPFLAPTSGITSGTFTIADRGETSANVFYRVILTVRDSAGLTHTSSVDVRPLTSVVSIESNVPSAQLTLDGMPITAPFTFTGVEGVIRTLGVVTPQTSGGTSYEFVSWSDGGAATHEIVTPNDDTTFTALFQPAATNIVFSDNFESAGGWTLTGGANTATTGRWQRGDPQATIVEWTDLAARDLRRPSVNCLVTGLTAGSAYAANDVDGGQTSIQSPPIALPATGTLTLTFRFYFAHLNKCDQRRLLPRPGGGEQRPGADGVRARGGVPRMFPARWTTRTVNLSAWAGQTVQLRFDAIDAGRTA